MNSVDAKRVLETALIFVFCSLYRSVTCGHCSMTRVSDTKMLLLELQQDWVLRGVELVQVATG